MGFGGGHRKCDFILQTIKFNNFWVTGYQHYEFSVVKELAETSLKLAEETGQSTEDQQQADKDQ
jgi:hypothetical protein